jgi:tetratricopeptide (TPR) repeat protein
MPLSAGDRLERYEILAPLGAGGVGEVYRAHDERLDRDVAIKVLPEAVARDSERLTRFEREARAVAELAHPNILEIWDFRQEGENLRQRIPTGALARAGEIMYERNPESPHSRWELAWALAADGRADEAHPVFTLFIRDSSDTGSGRSARLFQAALRGDREAASEAMTAELVNWASNDGVGTFLVAYCHALLGDVEGALRWLEIAMQRGWANYPALRTMPFFDGIRDDPRFQELAEELRVAWQSFEA